MKIMVADRQLVRPGDCLAILEQGEALPEEFKHIPERHVYIVNMKVYSDVLGIVDLSNNGISVIPLEGVYIPHKDDNVVGVISGIGLTSWTVDIKSPYKAILPASDVIEGFSPLVHNLKNYLDIGDYVYAKISVFDRLRDPVLTIKGKGLGKIIDGYVIDIKPSKIARVIGKKASMFNLLTNLTNCELSIGMNGYVWAKCPDETRLNVLIKAIRLIELKAHMRGLTEEVKMLIERELGVKH